MSQHVRDRLASVARQQPESTADSGLDISTVQTIDAVEADRWNGLVERSRLGSIFHRHEWLAAIEHGLGHQPVHLTVEKDTNLIGVFPNFVVPIPATPFTRLTSIYPGFGGPLLTTDVATALGDLLSVIADCGDRRTIVHEIRTANPNFIRYNAAFKRRGYDASRVGGRFLLNLASGYEAALEEMDSSRRRAIRRGREQPHTLAAVEPTRANLHRFYEGYRERMTEIDGRVYPFAFFDRLRALEDRLLLVALHVDGVYRGGFLALCNDEQSTVHGFFAGVPSSAFSYHASELVYDFLFRWTSNHEYEWYDFGGSGGDFEDGAFRFKERFGGTCFPNCYWERGVSPLWPMAKLGRTLYWRYGRR